ncbi:alpha/beta fold hydrolase [Pseudonocardia pini]|uniref:alpha/beta fold hydrolase n=1 Tax=Pseudonocardia pini TaxID=2758030 RepID=UPI0028B19EE3|nr:alpha/beta fold hydrolase [Pseudonocardia pini]
MVPLDYADPDGPTVSVRVSKVPASDPARRRGILITNPGGPGAPALFNAVGVDGLIGGGLAQVYDLVGFDPRGVHASSPLSCGLTAEQARVASVDAPVGPDDDDLAEQAALACAAHPEVLHTTMDGIARDMDSLRKALGEETISYYGTSGGTSLGTTYDALFPGRLDRAVLDSVDDDTVSWQEAFRASNAAIDARFVQLAARLVGQDPTLGPDLRARYLALRERLDQDTVIFDGVRATPQALGALADQALRSDAAAGLFAEAIRYLDGLPGAPTEADLAARLGPEPNPAAATAAQADAERIASAFLAITCADPSWSSDPADYALAQARDAAAYPVSQGVRASISPCAFWAGPRIPRTPPTGQGRAGTFLLIQNRFDPATPAAGAQHTREALGARAVMVTTGRGGHGVLGVDACATAAARAFLLDGRLPAHDIDC